MTLDILVNNAGAAWGAQFEDFPEQGWDKVMDLNVKSPFFLTQAFLNHLKAGAAAHAPAKVINVRRLMACASMNGRLTAIKHRKPHSFSSQRDWRRA